VAWRGCRGALVGLEAVAAEAHAMELVISVMLDREGSLSEMTKPERLQKARERVVFINPNYHADEVLKYVGSVGQGRQGEGASA
jgi:hypothetical protein